VDSFTDAVIKKALEKVPSREKIQSEMQFDYSVALFFNEQDTILGEAKRAELSQIKSAELSKAQAAADKEKYQAALAYHEFDHIREMEKLAEDERRLKIDAMLAAENAHAREQLSAMASPFEEVFSGLRCRMAAAAETMLESIKKNGFVRGKVAQQGRGLMEIFELMAVQDDRELREKLLALQASLGPERIDGKSPDRSTAGVISALEEISVLAESAAADLAAKPDRFSNVIL
jgi:hypothetical protein